VFLLRPGAPNRRCAARRSLLKVQLPDGKVLEVPAGASSKTVAEMIGPGLARNAVAAKVGANGDAVVYDLNRPLPGDCRVAILTANDESAESLSVLRHSTAHVMAEAICKLFPDTRLVYGPPIEDGFYYDIDLPRPLTPDDFEAIEAEMARIVKENRPFTRYELSRNEGMTKLKAEGSRYKIDNAERADGDVLSFYVTGCNPGADFEDLCRGPHVPATGVIAAFKVRQVSGSHYRGDVNDTPLQRVYGTAFFKKKSLTEFLDRLEEAKKRDHRVLGKQLDLFTVSERVGAGLILWLPNGAVIRTELQNFLTGEMRRMGYDLVFTPHIGNLDLYRTSGHFPYYEDSQFPAMFESPRGKAIQSALVFAQQVKAAPASAQADRLAVLRPTLEALQTAYGEIDGLSAAGPDIDATIKALYDAQATEHGFLLKPMNCPHHVQIYASRPRSYRDLPVRLAEYGTVYRFEQSGELSGMTRVRGFTQDDAHLFCTADQLAAELSATIELTRKVLELLGLTDYRVRLGMRDPASAKYVGSAENWDKAQDAVRQAAQRAGIAYTEEAGEAAFYGPKIDFVVKDCIGRSWQLGTVQVDYSAPERFDLTYIGADNHAHRPIMIHRAPFGSMERFVGILIEHFNGAFPLWLSPVQVGIATVSEKSEAVGRTVQERLLRAGLRSELDLSSEKIGPKKHRLRAMKINYIVVIGEREAEEGTLNVNDRDGRSLGNMTVDRFIECCREEIDKRSMTPLIGA
jgi:threonyl-tRNA synthetase